MLFDPIRSCAVEATPEEKVRQTLILQLIGPLGFPKGLIAVEKELSALSSQKVPSTLNRRVDVVCFCPVGSTLRPLLLIECKADVINEKAENQLFGYNSWIGAPFISLVSENTAKTLWREKGGWISIPYIPPYHELKQVFDPR